MDIANKYQQLKSQGFLPVTVGGFELPVVSVPVGDGQGTFFSYAFQVGGGSTPITIYHHPSIGTFEVHGAILADYLFRGGPLGALGYPVSDEYDDVANGAVIGRASDFQRGSTFWNKTSGAISVMLVGPVTEDFEIVEGIDVSGHQGTIDWTLVAANGIEFAYIKATEANNVTDGRFSANWAAAKGKVKRGAYHFFHPRATPDANRPQSDHFINTLAATNDPAELPPMVDVEVLAADVTPAQAVASLQFYISLVEQAFGTRPVIYTFPSFWKDTLGNPTNFAQHFHLWIANYGAKRTDGGAERPLRGPIIPGGWTRHSIWQYAVLPGLPGIATLVDRNSVFLPAGGAIDMALKLKAFRFKYDPVLEAYINGTATLRVLNPQGPFERGRHVRRIQQALLDLNFQLPQHGADSEFGPETTAAVFQFKQERNIRSPDGSIDGAVGVKTMTELDAIFADEVPFSPPPRAAGDLTLGRRKALSWVNLDF